MKVRGNAFTAAQLNHPICPALAQERSQIDTHFLERCQMLARSLICMAANLLFTFGIPSPLFPSGRTFGLTGSQIRLLPLLSQLNLGLHLDTLLCSPSRCPVHLTAK
jgi:hypothetical protein